MAKQKKEPTKNSMVVIDQARELILALDAFEPGNAIALVELLDKLDRFCNDLASEPSNLLQKTAALLKRLSGSIARHESVIIPLLKSGISLITDGKDKNQARLEKWVQDIQQSLTQLAEPKQPDSTLSSLNDSIYEDRYFDAIVEDKKLLRQFFNEAIEHLDEAQSVLIEVEYDQSNKELLNTLFRAFHTIKGSAAFLGLKNIEEFSHSLEDLLALVRDGRVVLVKELINVVFSGIDLLKTILDTMAINDFNIKTMVDSFRLINIFPFIKLMRKIINEYRHKRIGEILEEDKKLSKEELGLVIEKQKTTDKLFGEIALEERLISNDDLLSAIKRQKEQAAKLKKIGFVKVANEKLNTLIDIVGELVINQSMLKQELVNLNNSESIERSLGQLESITTTIKNLVLSMGMVPIAEVFNKLRVIARNTASECEKSVFVEMHGEETELDRNVIETIYDPLMHLLRNAIDHGIENPTERQQAGKDSVGKIIVQADHKGSGIEISLYDDGRGIDKNQLLRKALKQKLIKDEDLDKLSDKDIFALLFLPGFSTTESVTKVSGRGVGLDVVKKNIESIHGRVDISSEPAKYTRFSIKLPLSLAIIEGFVTRIGLNKYIFPFTSIEEINVFRNEDFIYTEGENELIIFYRNQHIPVIFAHELLKEKPMNSLQDNKLLCLLFSIEHTKYCVVVDEIIGKQEIVIKTLSGALKDSRRFLSGGTIFGDGSIGFVIDLQGFIEALQKA